MGESLAMGMTGVDVDSSTDGGSNWMGMSESVQMEGGGSMEMLQSVAGTGEGVGEGGALSCIGGAGASAKGAGVASGKGGVVESRIGVILLMSSTGEGGVSNVELGGGSMTGVVQTSTEVGTDSVAGVVPDSFVGEGATSFIWGMVVSKDGLTESSSGAAVSSALLKSGSVAHGALCKGVEESRCSLLASIMHSLSRAVMGVNDEAETERPLGSLGSGLLG